MSSASCSPTPGACRSHESNSNHCPQGVPANNFSKSTSFPRRCERRRRLKELWKVCSNTKMPLCISHNRLLFRRPWLMLFRKILSRCARAWTKRLISILLASAVNTHCHLYQAQMKANWQRQKCKLQEIQPDSNPHEPQLHHLIHSANLQFPAPLQRPATPPLIAFGSISQRSHRTLPWVKVSAHRHVTRN